MSEPKSPKVSVIIPTHNRASLLPRAVRSVLAQTFSDYEIIIVDDCSQDNTQEVIAGFDDPRIRAIRHDRNRRQSASINTGIAAARGEYIAFLDDDDEWLPKKLEGQTAILDSRPDSGMVYGWLDRVENTTGHTTAAHRRRMEGNVFDRLLGFDLPGPTSTLMVRSTILREIGGLDENLTRENDQDLLCRITYRHEVSVLPEVVCRNYYNHGYQRMTDDNPKNFDAEIKYLMKHQSLYSKELNENPSAKSATLRVLARIEAMRGNRYAATSAFATALRLDPIGGSRAVFKNIRLVLRLLTRLMRKTMQTPKGQG